MPKLIVKTIYIEKLKALSCYNAWLANTKAAGRHDSDLLDLPDFKRLIGGSFDWEHSPEGWEFWNKLRNS